MLLDRRFTSDSELALSELEAGEEAQWDALVTSSPASGFMQSISWSRFKAREGYTVLRPAIRDPTGKIVGGGLCYCYPADGGPTVLLMPHGPILPWGEHDGARAGMAALLTWAEGAAATYGAYALRIEPRIMGPLPRVLRGWVRAPIDLYPYQTQLLDLRQGPDALLLNMKQKCRYNIRLAQRHGVEVASADELRGLPDFYDLFRATAQRQDFFAEPYGFFLNLASEHCPSGTTRFFCARWRNAILATALVIFHGATATFLYGGSTEQYRELMAPYALQWAIMNEAMEGGMEWYDFYGCEPFGLADHPYAGFSRFKRQFGGHLIQYVGAHEWVFYDRLADAVVTALRPDTQRSN